MNWLTYHDASPVDAELLLGTRRTDGWVRHCPFWVSHTHLRARVSQETDVLSPWWDPSENGLTSGDYPPDRQVESCGFRGAFVSRTG